VKEKPKNNKPKNPGDGDAKAETNPDAKSDA
jgi:hypothetical protein